MIKMQRESAREHAGRVGSKASVDMGGGGGGGVIICNIGVYGVI